MPAASEKFGFCDGEIAQRLGSQPKGPDLGFARHVFVVLVLKRLRQGDDVSEEVEARLRNIRGPCLGRHIKLRKRLGFSSFSAMAPTTVFLRYGTNHCAQHMPGAQEQGQ